jgi:hypothetical protein
MTEEEQRIIDEAVAWCKANPPGTAEVFLDELEPLRRAVDAYQSARPTNEPMTDMPMKLTWGQVPAGWFIQAPNNAWMEVLSSRRVGPLQAVAFKSLEKSFKASDPVRVCPGSTFMHLPHVALGFPDVLDDPPW